MKTVAVSTKDAAAYEAALHKAITAREPKRTFPRVWTVEVFGVKHEHRIDRHVEGFTREDSPGVTYYPLTLETESAASQTALTKAERSLVATAVAGAKDAEPGIPEVSVTTTMVA